MNAPIAEHAAVSGLRSLVPVAELMASIVEGIDLSDPQELAIARKRYEARIEAVKEARKREGYEMRLANLALTVAEGKSK